jgi:hypothetical protein
MSGKTSIRFEDLGDPVQRLLRSLHGGKGGDAVSDEDLTLLEYVSVKDMAKIYQEMASERHADQIWEELKAALIARREKAERSIRERDGRFKDVEQERALAEEEALRLAKEAEDATAEAEKRKRRDERKIRKAREAAAAAAEEERAALEAEAALAEQQAADEEAARQAEEEEAQRRRADKKKRRDEKARRLREEAEAIQQEQAADKESRRKKRDQKREWDDYVASHPLEFGSSAPAPVIQQVKKDEEGGFKRQVLADDSLLNRTYTPQCPSCHAKYSKAPPEWDCPMCLRKFRQHIKCWQPDDVSTCACCKSSVGRFSRHHCRNCGRISCGKCSEMKVLIPSLGYKDTPVRACVDCMNQLAPAAVEAAKKK